jgi:hypothetical protein
MTTTPNPSAVAFLAQAIDRLGLNITLQRNVGVAPNVTSTSVTVPAIVRKTTPDTTQEAQAGLPASQMGNISQDDRMIIIRNADLNASGFPLPIQKGDWIIFPTGGDNLTVTEVDPYFRIYEDAVQLTASGVQ